VAVWKTHPVPLPGGDSGSWRFLAVYALDLAVNNCNTDIRKEMLK
jgi:hypothetical protein